MTDPFCLSYVFRYVKQLKESQNYRATTIIHKLTDLSHFFKWVKESHPDWVRVSKKALKRAILIIQMCIKEESKHRLSWQQEIQMLKSGEFL